MSTDTASPPAPDGSAPDAASVPAQADAPAPAPAAEAVSTQPSAAVPAPTPGSPGTAPRFAPDDPNDGRQPGHWQTRYDSAANGMITFEALYLAGHLVFVPLAFIILTVIALGLDRSSANNTGATQSDRGASRNEAATKGPANSSSTGTDGNPNEDNAKAPTNNSSTGAPGNLGDNAVKAPTSSSSAEVAGNPSASTTKSPVSNSSTVVVGSPLAGWIQFAYAWIGGILGGTLFSIKWLYHSVARNIWNIDRRLWRLFTPHVSGALAFVFVVLSASRLIAIFDSQAFSSQWVCFGLGFLVGYFSDSAVAKLSEIAQTLFGSSRPR